MTQKKDQRLVMAETLLTCCDWPTNMAVLSAGNNFGISQ
jgi:hypothetical protein